MTETSQQVPPTGLTDPLTPNPARSRHFAPENRAAIRPDPTPGFAYLSTIELINEGQKADPYRPRDLTDVCCGG